MSLQRICSHATFYAGGVKLCLKTAHKRKICKTASITGLLLRFIAIFRVNGPRSKKTAALMEVRPVLQMKSVQQYFLTSSEASDSASEHVITTSI